MKKRAPDKTGAAIQASQGWLFPLRLHRYLQLLGWSESELSRISGVSVHQINRILQGKRGVSIESATKIIGAFRVAPVLQVDLLLALLPKWVAKLPSQRTFLTDYREQRTILGESRYTTHPAHKKLFVRSEVRLEADTRLQELKRIVRLFVLGFYVDPGDLADDDLKRTYIDDLLRPAARARPKAAWALAHYVSLEFLKSSGDSPWSAYRLVRRGAWPWDRRPTTATGRLTRPRKKGRSWRPRRPLAFEEHEAVAAWNINRTWVGEDARFSSEVARLIDEATEDLGEGPRLQVVELELELSGF